MRRPGGEAGVRYPDTKISIRGLFNSYRISTKPTDVSGSMHLASNVPGARLTRASMYELVPQTRLDSFANSQVGGVLRRVCPPLAKRYTPSPNATRMLY